MSSTPVLKTILYNGNILYNSGKSLSSIIAILSATHFYSGNAIISKSLKYSVFHGRDITI